MEPLLDEFQKHLTKYKLCIILIYTVGVDRSELTPVERALVSMKQEALTKE